jgi:hypothetical protein
LIGVIVVFLGPLPTLVTVGMEHTLHVLLVLVFVRLLAIGYQRRHGSVIEYAQFGAVAALLTSTRYESLCLVLLGAGLMGLRRGVRAGSAVLAAGILPIAAFGVYCRAHGQYFLPLSVLLKRRPIEVHQFADLADVLGGDLLHRLAGEVHLLALALTLLVLAAYLLHCSRTSESQFETLSFCRFRRGAWLLLIGEAMLCFHVQFGGLGWFYRYDSYLVVLLLTLSLTVIAEHAPLLTRENRKQPERWLAASVILVLLAALGRRASEAASGTPLAARNIFEQQVQSARFLATWFPTGPVAVNDIGAVAYYRRQPLVDLLGLADKAIADSKGLRIDKPMSPEVFQARTQDAKVAILYDEWFVGQIPLTWVKVAIWGIDGNRSCAFPNVSIYATRPEAIAEVTHAVLSFRGALPKGVRLEIPETKMARQR